MGVVILRIFLSAMQEQTANLFLVASNTTHILQRKENKKQNKKPITKQQHPQDVDNYCN